MKISKTLMVLLLSGAVGGTSLTAQQQPAGQRTQPYDTQRPQQQQQELQRDQQQLQQRQQELQRQQQQDWQRQQQQQGLQPGQRPGQEQDLMQQVRVVDKDTLDNELTANNLIGKNVYSTDGNRLGSVHDIKLGGTQFAQLRQSFLRGEMDDRTWTGRTTDRTADRVDRQIDRTGDRVDRQIDRTDDALVRDPAHRPTAADRVERGADRTADAIERTGERAADAMRDIGDRTADTMHQMGQQQAEIIAVVQTGGILGIGSDYIAVPLDQLRYDANEERFQIAMTEAQWEQLRGRGDRGTTRTRN
jgi:hypothetical protein